MTSEAGTNKTTEQREAALAAIADLDEPERLRTMIANAKRLDEPEVAEAAFLRLCEVQPSERSGSVEHDVWRSIFALEEMLREERGKTVLLSRTRQKIKRDGEIKTVADLTMRDVPSDGFHDLISRGHPELLFEAVVLRHAAAFDAEVTAAAKKRFEDHDIDPSSVAH